MELLRNYWPIFALILWFTFKWYSARRIKAKLPELKRLGAVFLDVRSQGEFQASNAPNTLNIPLQELSSRLNELSKSTPIVVCCASGTRSGMAKMLLKKNGFSSVYNIGAWTNFLN
jgi:rhodanese-related sulfurtransferase